MCNTRDAPNAKMSTEKQCFMLIRVLSEYRFY